MPARHPAGQVRRSRPKGPNGSGRPSPEGEPLAVTRQKVGGI